MSGYEEKFVQSRDGLRLYYRDHAGAFDRAPVLCLHGLTRNCRDFESVAASIAPRRRVITVDQRGRGRSQYDPVWLNYHPGTYVTDMWALLDQLSIRRAILIGTSLGGLMAILMAAMRPQALAGVVLNDIGPELDPTGAQRIANYAGRLAPVNTWGDAVDQVKQTFGLALPDYGDAQWREFAEKSFIEDASGVPRLAADPRIGDALRSIPAPPGATQGMWLAFCALRNVPTLAIRGAHSDLLSESTFDRMQRELPHLKRVTVPNRGHPPQLDEPEAREALRLFVDGIDE